MGWGCDRSARAIETVQFYCIRYVVPLRSAPATATCYPAPRLPRIAKPCLSCTLVKRLPDRNVLAADVLGIYHVVCVRGPHLTTHSRLLLRLPAIRRRMRYNDGFMTAHRRPDRIARRPTGRLL